MPSLSLWVYLSFAKHENEKLSFKDDFTFEQRLEESCDIIAKYPDRVPVIAKRYSKTDLPDMEKKNWFHLTPGKALFVFVKNTLPQTATLMDLVYESFKDEDGFLYMCYNSEKTFGYARTQTC